MANFTGILSTLIETGLPNATPSYMGASFYTTTYDSWEVGAHGVGTHALAGADPITPNNYNGFLVGMYAEIFYNRILIEPSLVNLGNLVANQTREITVFNGFFNSVAMNALTTNTTVADGILLTGDKPPPDVDFTALQARTYSLAISLTGPPSVSGEFQFSFTGISTVPKIEVTGSRIVLLPYPFRNGVTERFEWLTNVLEFRDGSEQRIRTRPRGRQFLQAEINLNRQQIMGADNLLYGWRKQGWAVPLWGEARIATTVTADAKILTVDTTYADFIIGGLALIWTEFDTFDVFSISAMTSTSLSADRGFNATYTNAFIVPVKIARMTADPTRLSSGYQGQLNANFKVIDTPTLSKITVPAEEQFLGVDVYLEGPLLNPDYVTDVYSNRVDEVDYKSGSSRYYTPWLYSKINRQFRLVLEGMQEVWEFKQWLQNREGKLIPFYMPTFENNVDVITEGFLTSVVVAKNTELTTQGAERIHLAVKILSGGWQFATVSSYGTDAEGNSIVTLTAPLNLNRTNIEFISFMGLKRLSADSISIKRIGNGAAEVILPVIELKP